MLHLEPSLRVNISLDLVRLIQSCEQLALHIERLRIIRRPVAEDRELLRSLISLDGIIQTTKQLLAQLLRPL